MGRRRYAEEQIIAVLKEGEAGAKVADLCRKYGMSDATYYNRKARYAGLTASDLKRLKSLEEENRSDSGCDTHPSRPECRNGSAFALKLSESILACVNNRTARWHKALPRLCAVTELGQSLQGKLLLNGQSDDVYLIGGR
jgi:putative transposase